MKALLSPLILLLLTSLAVADDEAGPDAIESRDETPAAVPSETQRTLSGMSILGNEEAPKALVIVPWKSSQLGDEVDLANLLDDRPIPVDKTVFLRQLRFYRIRAGRDHAD